MIGVNVKVTAEIRSICLITAARAGAKSTITTARIVVELFKLDKTSDTQYRTRYLIGMLDSPLHRGAKVLNTGTVDA